MLQQRILLIRKIPSGKRRECITIPIRQLLFAFFLSTIMVGCNGGTRSSAERTAQRIGVSKLRDDLRTLVLSRAGWKHDIPPASWPQSVRRFQPMAVQLHMDGVLIVLIRMGREQEGLLVMLNPRDDPGAGGSGADYHKVGDGLYWCREKVRDTYIPPEQVTNK